MSKSEENLAELAGIATSYVDQNERSIAISVATRQAVLAALGFDLRTPASVERELAALKAEAASPLPQLLVVEADVATALPSGATGVEIPWSLTCENGDLLEGKFSSQASALPALPAGYHRLQYGSPLRTTFIFSAPPRCYCPEKIASGQRAFGISAQVYSLRRDSDMGIGDLGHVFDLAQGCGALGADLLGLSPLHALFPSDRPKISPYSPSTRFFIDPIYIDAAAIPGSRGPDRIEPDARPQRLLDVPGVWARKSQLLRDVWDERRPGIISDPAFQSFLEEQGDRLRSHATFDALSAHFASQGLTYSGAWPKPFRPGTSVAVREFCETHNDEILYWCWLQYLADAQLLAASAQARLSGMAIGLYRDIAVGADLYGSEVWSEPDAWCSNLSIGAPPDPLGPKGQDWGLPPLNPRHMARDGLATFRALIASNMRHAGAVRIDHAFQLQRLFVIPRGRSAAEGAYLNYPFEALLAVLRIESHRARCAVIAEDLGNGPKGFSTRIMKDGIFSYRILAFERRPDGDFVPPGEYPPLSVASINTHDLPTFAGWWRGLDIDLRECFGVYDAADWKREKVTRKLERAALLDALHDEALTEAPDVTVETARGATMRYLARTRSALAILSLEDIGGELNQPNLPGLADGYPNWRRRLNQSIEQMTATYGDLARASSIMTREGRGTRRVHPAASRLPRATYRLQLNRDFPFDRATEIIPKLKALGISHLYVSPITTAMPGSMHGYDVTDPTKINPELGGREAFEIFVKALQGAGLGLIVDIVPNHMAANTLNPWWESLLAEGATSAYARYFDVDWHRHSHGKLVLPILPKPRGNMFELGEITLTHDESADRLRVKAGAILPISMRDEDLVRSRICQMAPMGRDLATALQQISAGDLQFLMDLVDRQAWRAAYWRSGRPDINYRRFFEIDALAGLCIEDPAVFEASHALIFELVHAGKIQGLRIDHIDGLADPRCYLERLQNRVGPGFYVVVEKILGIDEELPDWPVSGTTGYDALRLLDGIFLDPQQETQIDAIHRSIVQRADDPKEMLATIKSDLVETSFSPELSKLVDLAHVAIRETSGCADLSRETLRRLLRDFIAHIPVYRTYLDSGPVSDADAKVVDVAIRNMEQAGDQDGYAIACLRRLLLSDASCTPTAVEFRTRLQQLSGPVMAKGQEDTLFYRHHRLVVQSEVGGELGHPPLTLDGFHAANVARLDSLRGTMIATATHDTKRGEDTRARLLALAQHPSSLEALWSAWMAAAARHGMQDLDPSDHYMAMQNVIAAWPSDMDSSFEQRIAVFLTKALREGKLRSNWTAPNIDYEKRLHACVCAIIHDARFLSETNQLRRRLNMHGAWIALSRTVLKCTVPGTPDFYQGTEGWDLSLVDPDNRRPVPFEIPQRAQGSLSQLLRTWEDGRVKCELTRRLLALRREDPDLFALGSYEPVPLPINSPWILYRRVCDVDSMTIAVRRFFDDVWEGPSLPAQAYLELNSLYNVNTLRNLLSDHPRTGGTAASWQEFCGGLPFCIMRPV